MSSHTDDKLIDAELTEPYLLGDSKYSKLYREIDSDDVPPELDSLVLAEATSAVRVRKGSAWKRYAPLFAVAATAVLTVSVVLRNGNYQTQPVVQEDAAAIATSNVTSSAETQKLNVTPAEAPKVEAVPIERTRGKESAPQFYDRAVADAKAKEKKEAANSERDLARAELAQGREPVAEPQAFRKAVEQEASSGLGASTGATPSRSNSEIVVTGSTIRSTPEDAALPVTVVGSEDLAKLGAPRVGPRDTIPAPAPAAPTANRGAVSLEEVVVTAQQRQASNVASGPRGSIAPPMATGGDPDRRQQAAAREQNPEQWLAYIRELRADGKSREADREWDRFLMRYPRHRVDANDTARPVPRPR